MKKQSTVDECPKFNQCSAPVCPLDNDWRMRKHCSEDPICFYLLEAQKEGAEGIFDRAGLGDLYPIMLRATPEIIASAYPLKKAIERAKKSGSRMARVIKQEASL